jgi:hypothetical protein
VFLDLSISICATRQAMAVNTVACVNRLRGFGNLVMDPAAQAAPSLRKFHCDYFSCPGATDRMGTGFRFLTEILVQGRDSKTRLRDYDPYPPRGRASVSTGLR